MKAGSNQTARFAAATAVACALLLCMLYLIPRQTDQGATRKNARQKRTSQAARRGWQAVATAPLPQEAGPHRRQAPAGLYPENAPTTPQIAVAVQGDNQLQSLLQTLQEAGVAPRRIIPGIHAVVIPNDYHLLARLRRLFPAITWENDAVIQTPKPPTLTAQTPGVPFGGILLNWLGIDPQTPGRGKGVTIALLDQPLTPSKATECANITQIDPFKLTHLRTAGHGNAVASLIVAQSSQLQGIAPEARILSIPVLDQQGTGSVFTLAEAIIEATDRGADIISLSLGTDANSAILQQAVDYAVQQGTVIVAAAGNDGGERPIYPAACPQVVAVAACDAASNIAPFSNRGKHVDIAAPGLELMADFGPENDQENQMRLGFFSGTSAATPCVSAAIAGIMADNPGLTPLQAAEIVRATAVDNGLPGTDPQYGKGVLNLRHASHWNDQDFTDAAIAGHHLDLEHATETTTPLVVSAQNSGNTRLPDMTLVMSVNGHETRKTFTDVPPGQTISVTMDIPNDQREHITVTSEVTTEASESTTQNNRKTSRITVRAAEPQP